MNHLKHLLLSRLRHLNNKWSDLSRNTSSFILKDIHEPKYLDYLKPQIPYYPLINVQIRGYDYAVLESYASYLHKLSNKLGVNVVSFWCSPSVNSKYDNLMHESDVSESTYCLNLFERNLQIENLSAKMAPILIEIIYSSLPAGVRLSIHEHSYYLHEESRYIPDLQLAAFKAELEELKGSDILEPEKDTKAKK